MHSLTRLVAGYTRKVYLVGYSETVTSPADIATPVDGVSNPGSGSPRIGDVRPPRLGDGGELYDRKPSLSARLHWAKYHAGVSGTLLSVLIALMTFANVNGWAYPSIGHVAEATDGAQRSRRWLRNRLHKLAELGLIRLYVSAGYRTDRGATNAYRILWRRCDCEAAAITETGAVRPLNRRERRALALAARRGRSYPHGGSRPNPNPVNPPVEHIRYVSYPTLWGEFDPSGGSPPG